VRATKPRAEPYAEVYTQMRVALTTLKEHLPTVLAEERRRSDKVCAGRTHGEVRARRFETLAAGVDGALRVMGVRPSRAPRFYYGDPYLIAALLRVMQTPDGRHLGFSTDGPTIRFIESALGAVGLAVSRPLARKAIDEAFPKEFSPLHLRATSYPDQSSI
jgi:hypothetical protein